MRPSSLSRKRVKDSSLLLAENENKRREESLTLFFSCFRDRKSTRLNSSHSQISYAVFCLKKKKKKLNIPIRISLKTNKPKTIHNPMLKNIETPHSIYIRPFNMTTNLVQHLFSLPLSIIDR